MELSKSLFEGKRGKRLIDQVTLRRWSAAVWALQDTHLQLPGLNGVEIRKLTNAKILCPDV